MNIIAPTAATLRHLGLRKLSSYLTAFDRIGQRTTSDGSRTSFGNLTRGIKLVLSRSEEGNLARLKIINARAMNTSFKDVESYEEWVRKSQWPAPKIVSGIIENINGNNNELRILDIGSNAGTLVDAIEEHAPNQLKNIKRYIGVDISKKAVVAGREKYPEYTFVSSDILANRSYDKTLKTDNNIIVCSGLCDYLSPKEIRILLENLNSVLDKNSDSRIILSYASTFPSYIDEPNRSDLFYKGIYLEALNKQKNGRFDVFHEEGIPFVVSKEGASVFYRYFPDTLKGFFESAGFEIDAENSFSNSHSRNLRPHKLNKTCSIHSYNHVCLKRKSK